MKKSIRDSKKSTKEKERQFSIQEMKCDELVTQPSTQPLNQSETDGPVPISISKSIYSLPSLRNDVIPQLKEEKTVALPTTIRIRKKPKLDPDENTEIERVAVQFRPVRSRLKKRSALKWKGADEKESSISEKREKRKRERKKEEGEKALKSEPKIKEDQTIADEIPPVTSETMSSSAASEATMSSSAASESSTGDQVEIKGKRSKKKKKMRAIEERKEESKKDDSEKESERIREQKKRYKRKKMKKKMEGLRKKKIVSSASEEDSSAKVKLKHMEHDALKKLKKKPKVDGKITDIVRKDVIPKRKLPITKDIEKPLVKKEKKTTAAAEEKEVAEVEEEVTTDMVKLKPVKQEDLIFGTTPSDNKSVDYEATAEKLVRAVEFIEGIPPQEPQDLAIEESSYYSSDEEDDDMIDVEGNYEEKEATPLQLVTDKATTSAQGVANEVTGAMSSGFWAIAGSFVDLASRAKEKIESKASSKAHIICEPQQKPLEEPTTSKKPNIDLAHQHKVEPAPQASVPEIDENSQVVLSVPACEVLEIIIKNNFFDRTVTEYEAGLLTSFFAGQERFTSSIQHAIFRAMDKAITRVRDMKLSENLQKFLMNRQDARNYMLDVMQFNKKYVPKCWKR